MSSKPRPRCSAMPSDTSRASTIMPAQVASVGNPPSIAARSGPDKPTRSMSIVIVVLSPPGKTMPSRPTRSGADLTMRVFTPHASSARKCSAKAPCSASTPITAREPPRDEGIRRRSGSVPDLPASGSEQLFLRDGGNLEPMHRLPQAGGDVGQHFRLVEVGGGGHDRLGHLQRLLRLEDARADEDTVDPELHHQGGVGWGRDPAGRE